VFDKFPKYHMKNLIRDFNAKVGREDIFKTNGNESLHDRNILGRLQIGKPAIRLTIFWYIGEGIRVYLMFDYSGQQIVILITIWWWQHLGRD
jgi:hypothetical protein